MPSTIVFSKQLVRSLSTKTVRLAAIIAPGLCGGRETGYPISSSTACNPYSFIRIGTYADPAFETAKASSG
jgi:hypothetical protein